MMIFVAIIHRIYHCRITIVVVVVVAFKTGINTTDWAPIVSYPNAFETLFDNISVAPNAAVGPLIWLKSM